MAKENLVEIGFILDRSSSMDHLASEAIGGFNSFLKTQQELDGEAKLTVVQFDHEYIVTVDGVSIHDVVPLNETTYVPRGMTALLDAIGVTISTIGQRLADTNEEDRPSKVIICILTDGQENSSKEFTQAKINEMITHQTDVYGWQFIFMASTLNAVQTSASYGITGSSTLSFAQGARGMSASYDSMSKAVGSLRSRGVIGDDWKGDNGDTGTQGTQGVQGVKGGI